MKPQKLNNTKKTIYNTLKRPLRNASCTLLCGVNIMDTTNAVFSALNLCSGWVNLYADNKIIAGFNFTVSLFCGIMAVSNAI